MKLYIPTTSLNFNNILSTESISPKAFYSQRGFGYSRWFTIPENEMDGAVLLYEQPAIITRPKSDLEDHPLLIEIETDEDFPILMPGVRYSQHTIYINPWNASLYFQTERDKTIALSMSDSSLETKLIRLYYNKMNVKSFAGSFLHVDNAINIPIDESSIKEDIIINKIKGLLYGFYIGANLSSSFEDIKKLNTLREIQNIFAAAVSSQDREPNEGQMERLSELFSLLSHEEPLYKELLNELGSPHVVNQVIAILRKFKIETNRYNWKIIVEGLKYDNNGHNSAISWIQTELDNHQKSMKSKIKLLSVSDEQIILNGKNISKVSCDILSSSQEQALYLYWINNLLIQSKYTGKVSSMKAEIADDLTQAAISCMGESWKDSEIRTFLNQLRKHVRGDDFSQPWKNGLLSSIAAVITKGDDWEILLRFLQTKGLTDYRLAFSFYGILNGYANLTRDFTDNLYNLESQYVATVYKEFYGQLHGVSIIGKLSEETPSYNSADKIGVKKYNETSQLRSVDETSDVSHSVIEEIWSYFDSSEFKKGLKKTDLLRTGLRLCIEKLGTDFTLPSFVNELSSFEEYGWTKRNKAWKLMQKRYYPEFKTQSTKRRKDTPKSEDIQTLSLFDTVKESAKGFAESIGLFSSSDNESSKENDYSPAVNSDVHDNFKKESLLLNDNLWIKHCETFIDDSRARYQFSIDIEWFIRNHNQVYHDKKKGDVKGYFCDANKSNVPTINRLKGYLERKLIPNNQYPQLVDIYRKIPIDQIIMYLEKLYVPRENTNH